MAAAEACLTLPELEPQPETARHPDARLSAEAQQQNTTPERVSLPLSLPTHITCSLPSDMCVVEC